MRGRFLLLGTAALIGAAGMAGQARAAEQCSDYRNQARIIYNHAPRQPDDLQKLEELSSRANSCAVSVRTDIAGWIASVRGAAPPPATTTTTTVAPPPRTGPVNLVARSRPIAIGQRVDSELNDQSAVLSADEHIAYEVFTFRAAAGQPLQITMTATSDPAVDTYVVIGRMRNGAFEEIDHNDDRPGGTFNSLLNFTPQETGEYVIRARSYGQEQYGAYQLIVQPPPPPVPSQALTVGRPVIGTLTANSPIDGDSGIAFGQYSFQAAAGQRLRIAMTARSDNFDTYLSVGRMVDGEYQEVASNDDRGDGSLNSLVRLRAEEAGEYVVRARTYAPNTFGNYELLVEPMPFSVEARVPLDRVANAWTRAGQLADGAEYIDYEFQAVRGHRYSVRVYSTDFMPTVDVGALGSGSNAALVDNVAAGEHTADAAEFVADGAGRYVFRVGATDAASGNFNLIVSEVR